MGGPNRDLKEESGLDEAAINAPLTLPNAAREGRVGGATGSAGGKARG